MRLKVRKAVTGWRTSGLVPLCQTVLHSVCEIWTVCAYHDCIQT